jgi:hypothetical protein
MRTSEDKRPIRSAADEILDKMRCMPGQISNVAEVMKPVARSYGEDYTRDALWLLVDNGSITPPDITGQCRAMMGE